MQPIGGSWCYIQIIAVLVFVNSNGPVLALINNKCVVYTSELDLLNGNLVEHD